MKIRLNGEPVDVPGPLTIAALLAHYTIDARRVAVEHNLVVVKRAQYDTTTVNAGDEVEIVNFVGGGSDRRRAAAPRARSAAHDARRAKPDGSRPRPDGRRPR